MVLGCAQTPLSLWKPSVLSFCLILLAVPCGARTEHRGKGLFTILHSFVELLEFLDRVFWWDPMFFMSFRVVVGCFPQPQMASEKVPARSVQKRHFRGGVVLE